MYISNENDPLFIKVHIDNTICSNDYVKDFKDIYKYIAYIETNTRNHRDVDWIFYYIKAVSKPIIFYGIKIYTDIKSMREIVLEPKYLSKEEVLEFLEKKLECKNIVY
jgi:hypothetical protein